MGFDLTWNLLQTSFKKINCCKKSQRNSLLSAEPIGVFNMWSMHWQSAKENRYKDDRTQDHIIFYRNQHEMKWMDPIWKHFTCPKGQDFTLATYRLHTYNWKIDIVSRDFRSLKFKNTSIIIPFLARHVRFKHMTMICKPKES